MEKFVSKCYYQNSRLHCDVLVQGYTYWCELWSDDVPRGASPSLRDDDDAFIDTTLRSPPRMAPTHMVHPCESDAGRTAQLWLDAAVRRRRRRWGMSSRRGRKWAALLLLYHTSSTATRPGSGCCASSSGDGRQRRGKKGRWRDQSASRPARGHRLVWRSSSYTHFYHSTN